MILTNALLTAYCACKLCCGPNAKGITASGQRPVQGITIAASRTIPFGTQVFIDNKQFLVQDRLAKRFDSRFDLYFHKHEDAKKFGVKTNTIKLKL